MTGVMNCSRWLMKSLSSAVCEMPPQYNHSPLNCWRLDANLQRQSIVAGGCFSCHARAWGRFPQGIPCIPVVMLHWLPTCYHAVTKEMAMCQVPRVDRNKFVFDVGRNVNLTSRSVTVSSPQGPSCMQSRSWPQWFSIKLPESCHRCVGLAFLTSKAHARFTDAKQRDKCQSLAATTQLQVVGLL